VPKVQPAAQKCDYDEQTPGNGFRSLICLCDTVMLHLVAIFKECSETRNKPSFRASAICKDLENYVAILRFFVLALQQVVVLIDSLEEGSLFPSLKGNYSIHDGFFKGLESLDASCFYGRAFGFQVRYVYKIQLICLFSLFHL
jgi:hormone-sensitive lipase